MKRKPSNQINRKVEKKRRIETEKDKWKNLNRVNKINNFYISPSKIKNFINNDPVLDYYKKYYNQNYSPFTLYLFDLGNIFEQTLQEKLFSKFNGQIVLIANNYHDLTEEKYQETVKCIQNKVPIILQAPLINHKNNTRGIADLLVKGDYVNKITCQNYNFDPKLNSDLYYVIDIKFSTIYLNVNDNVSNSGLLSCYKSQLAIYNSALKLIQGKYSRYSFLWGKKYKQKNKIIGYYKDMLGIVDWNKNNDIIDRTCKAINWIIELENNHTQWTLYPPSIPELYPNMCNQYNDGFDEIKKEHAEEIKELTLLWNVGYKNRKIGHSNNIKCYNDNNISSSLLGINGKTRQILDEIIKINLNNDKLIKFPENIPEFKYDNQCIEFYIDYETFPWTLYNDDVLKIRNGQIIYMMGIGYMDNDKWTYKCFIMKDINDEENNIKNALNHIHDISKNKIIKLYHWSHAERSMMENASIKFNNAFESFTNMKKVDCLKVFKNNKIVVKGSMSFGLKNIAKNMFKNGLITIDWEDNISGLDAMYEGIKYYQNKNDEMIKKIIKYNEIDCRVLHEIVDYFR